MAAPYTILVRPAPDHPEVKFVLPDTNLTLATTNGTSAQTMAGTYNVSGTIDMNAGGGTFRRRVLASSGNTTMTAAMSGSVMLIDGASTDYALPAIAAADIGNWYDFVCTIVSTGTQTITAQAADLLMGYANVVDTAADVDVFVPDESDDLIITINGTTTGGKVVGSALTLMAITLTRWNVQATLLTATETQAIPFS